MFEDRKREITIKAKQFRDQCATGRYGIIDLFSDSKKLGYKIIRYPVENWNKLGFSLIRDHDRIIFTNTTSRLAREIFTLAHEIGHMQLHLNEATAFLDDDETISDKSDDEKEHEANYFAACLLMPQEAVQTYLDLELSYTQEQPLSAFDIARLMSDFNVSFEMALHRLENLKKIRPIDKMNLDNEKNKIHVGNLLKSVGGNEKLNRAEGITELPPEYLEYTIYNYNHRVIPEETLIRVLNCYHLTKDDIQDELILWTDPEEEESLDDLIGGLQD